MGERRGKANRVMKAMRLLRCAAVVVVSTGAGVILGLPASAQAGTADAIKAIDTGKDGTVSLNEAKSAAVVVIVKMDADHNGILDNKELGGRIEILDQLLRRRAQLRRKSTSLSSKAG